MIFKVFVFFFFNLYRNTEAFLDSRSIFSAHHPPNRIVSLVILYKNLPCHPFFVYFFLFIQQVFENLLHASHCSRHCRAVDKTNRSLDLSGDPKLLRNFALVSSNQGRKVRVGGCWFSKYAKIFFIVVNVGYMTTVY